MAKPNGTFSGGECYLAFSYGETYNEARYMLIAALIAAN